MRSVPWTSPSDKTADVTRRLPTQGAGAGRSAIATEPVREPQAAHPRRDVGVRRRLAQRRRGATAICSTTVSVDASRTIIATNTLARRSVRALDQPLQVAASTAASTVSPGRPTPFSVSRRASISRSAPVRQTRRGRGLLERAFRADRATTVQARDRSAAPTPIPISRSKRAVPHHPGACWRCCRRPQPSRSASSLNQPWWRAIIDLLAPMAAKNLVQVCRRGVGHNARPGASRASMEPRAATSRSKPARHHPPPQRAPASRAAVMVAPVIPFADRFAEMEIDPRGRGRFDAGRRDGELCVPAPATRNQAIVHASGWTLTRRSRRRASWATWSARARERHATTISDFQHRRHARRPGAYADVLAQALSARLPSGSASTGPEACSRASILASSARRRRSGSPGCCKAVL